MNKIDLLIRLKRNVGFTLIEVLLAMAVFSIAGIAILGAAENNFRSLSTLEQQTFANWIASNQLVEVHVETTWPPKNNKKGQVTMVGKEWFWLQKVVKTANADMRYVTIEVRLDEDEDNPIAQLHTYVAKVAP